MRASTRHEDGSLSIGTGTARRGEIVRCAIPVGLDMQGNKFSIPLVLINGVKSGPILWLNGATHGDEPEGAIGMLSLIQAVDPTHLKGSIVACPAMNPEAFRMSSRGNPLDVLTYDMNRVYPGKADGLPTERVSAAHWAAMEPVCDLQINVHSGGSEMHIAETLFVPETDACQEMAASMGPRCRLVVPIEVGSGNPSSKLAEHGKAAVGIEIGGSGRGVTEGVHVVGEAIRDICLNVMRHYGMIDGTAAYAKTWFLGRLILVPSPKTGLWLPRRDLPLLEPLQSRTPVGTVYSLHGEVLREVTTPCNGMIAGVRTRPQTHEGQPLLFFVAVEEERRSLTPGGYHAETSL